MDIPLTGRPDEVLDDLEQIILEAIERDDISQFYIGRSVDLDDAHEGHGSDGIIPLYQPESADNANEVEDSLLRTFFNHPKCENERDRSGGGVALDVVSNVYVAVWYR